MATNTDVPIYAATLATNTSSVTIDLSTYQQYASLKIVVTGRDSRTESNDGFGLTFNSDNSTGSTNYSDTFMYAANATTYSGRNSNYRQINLHQLNAANGSSTYFPVSIVHILNYSSSNMYKPVINSGGVTDEVYAATGTWRNNAPITSMTLWPGYNGSGYIFYAGTSIAVYGTGSATASTKATGGAIYSDDNYMYHVFTSTGSFTPTQTLSADVLVVAGGGGGSAAAGGGGGAGGLLVQTGRSCSSGTAYTVTIGAAGAGAVSDGQPGSSGGNSVFDTITALGGAGGTHNTNGNSGGSGSGGGYGPTSGGSATQGNSGGATGYGNAGGGNSTAAGLPYSAGGGGGAGGAGETGNSSKGGDGGVGRTEAFFNAIGLATGAGETVNGLTYFAGGGGGSRDTVWGLGGYGGGGKGGAVINASTNSKPAKGKINTGGGGGGGNIDGYYNGPGNNQGVAGGSGIVVVRYAK